MDKVELLFNLNNCIFDFSNSLLRILRIPKEISNKKIRYLNAELTQYKKNDRCYVVGLGPSLKTVDFSKLNGDIIATNRYYKFDSNVSLKPTFYCIVDKAFFIGDAREDFKEIISRYPDVCYVLNGLYAAEILKQFKTIAHSYYAFMWNGAMSSKKKIDFTHILPAANNVVSISIMLGLYCGYQEIVLLGCDFSSFASPGMVHCYEEKNGSGAVPLDFELYRYSLTAHSHNELQKYACRKGIRIVNATRSSLLDSYPFDKKIMKEIYF